MTITLNGSTGITFPNSTIQASAGQVLQVVFGSTSTQASNTTVTYSDTGLTATITPKFATSNILAIITVAGVRKVTNNTFGQFIFVRNGSSLFNMESSAARNGSTTDNAIGSVSASYLDSPATVSAITYKVQFASANNNDGIIVQVAGNTSSTSTLTLMEIAG